MPSPNQVYSDQSIHQGEDRYTAESYYYFQKGPNGAEVASSLTACGKRLVHRLPEGKFIRWHLGRTGDRFQDER